MKKLFFLALLVCSIGTGFAQSFMHGVGAGILFGKTENADLSLYGGVTYSPRFNFIETESMSVSVGVPLTLGFSGSYSYSNYNGDVYEESDFGFMINAPLMINLNGGAGSTKENESRFGYFFGGGFGYHYGKYNLSEIIDPYEETSPAGGTVGPAANAGFRIAVGSHMKNIEGRFSYMKGITNAKPHVFGMAVLFNF